MAIGSRLVSLFSLSSIAVLICSLQTTPVAALSVDHAVRGLHHPAHDALAKRKRTTNSKRCKPRPAPASATPSPASSSDAPASSSAPAPAPAAPSPSPSSTTIQSSAPAPSPSPQSGNINTSTKFGLGWANGPTGLEKWQGLVSTIYTWTPACPDNAQSLGITCCPMLWGWNQVGQWQSQVMGTNPPCVMGPNEPEIPGQSNMDPGSGLSLWNQFVRPMKAQGSTLISPATTSDPAGKDWMVQFFQLCGGHCDVDFVACHWYDVSGDALIAYLTDLHNTYQLPLWLTEFACENYNGPQQCTQDQVWNFEKQVTAFMNQADYVVKFMAFGAMQDMQGVNTDNQLVNGDNSPNALGLAYAGH